MDQACLSAESSGPAMSYGPYFRDSFPFLFAVNLKLYITLETDATHQRADMSAVGSGWQGRADTDHKPI